MNKNIIISIENRLDPQYYHASCQSQSYLDADICDIDLSSLTNVLGAAGQENDPGGGLTTVLALTTTTTFYHIERPDSAQCGGDPVARGHRGQTEPDVGRVAEGDDAEAVSVAAEPPVVVTTVSEDGPVLRGFPVSCDDPLQGIFHLVKLVPVLHAVAGIHDNNQVHTVRRVIVSPIPVF